jgi:hypothetical protein
VKAGGFIAPDEKLRKDGLSDPENSLAWPEAQFS